MKIAIFLLATVFVAACGHKQVMTESTSNASNETISMNILWLKDKGEKFDVEMQLKNKTEKDIIVKLNDMNCSKGSAGGSLKHTFFNTGERTIDLTPNQMKQFRLVCVIGAKSPGSFKISVNRVFDNPDGDGSTKGKQIAGKLEWTAPDSN